MVNGTGTLYVKYDEKTNKCDTPFSVINQALKTGVDVVLKGYDTWFYGKTLVERYDPVDDGEITVPGVAFAGPLVDPDGTSAGNHIITIWADNAIETGSY